MHAKKNCVIHANCQGDALKFLLQLSPEFRARYDIRRVVNYEAGGKDIPDIHNCDLFLYQHLGSKWGEGCTDRLLPKLPARSVAICIPNMFFKGYWPFWRKPLAGEMDFADSLIEMLLGKGLPHEAVFNLYFKCDPALAGDFHVIAANSLEKEKEKEKRAHIKYAHIIEQNWQSEQLFLTANHPGPRLLAHVAQNILRMIGLPPLTEDAISRFQHPHGEFWMPIHPEAGRRLNLPFAPKDRLYECFGSLLTHMQYISCYLACRKHNFSNFVSVLMALDKNPQFLHPPV